MTKIGAIVFGDDAESIGRVVAELNDRHVRAAAFVGDPATNHDAILEMLTELFPPRDET
jgi:hypothetical protein